MMSTMENDFSQESRIKATQGPAYSTGNRNLFFPNAPTLYVEGHTDKVFWEKFILKDYCNHVKLTDPRGRSHVARAVKQANENRQNGGGPVLGVVDRDMGAGDLATIPNLFFYDEDDLEIMIIKSEAFEDTLKTIFIDVHWGQLGEIRKRLLDACSISGKLRLFFSKNKKSLKLDGSPSLEHILCQSISFDPLEVKINNLLKLVIESNPKCFIKTDIYSIEESLKLFLKGSAKNNYCRGHDAVEILRCFIKNGPWQVQGNRRNISHEDLHNYIFLPFQWPHFEPTKIKKKIIEWVDVNKIQRLFRFT